MPPSSAGQVVLLGVQFGGGGICLAAGGELHKLLADSDPPDGLTVDSLNIPPAFAAPGRDR